MKQYTTPEQTSKLIELGFEKPKSIGGYKPKLSVEYEGEQVSRVDVSEDTDSPIYAYSIGKLIEMLPQTIKNYYDLSIFSTLQGWRVLYGMIGDGDMWSVEYELYRKELIDALYDMIVKLKEEKLI